MMVINNVFNLGQTVYLKTDTDQLPRIVTCITIYPTGLMYELSYGTGHSNHYDFEISEEVNELIKVK